MTYSYQEYRAAWDKGDEGICAEVPLDVSIELAKECNLRCIMCPWGDKEWENTQPQGMMDLGMAHAILRQVRELQVPSIKANFRGEPLLYKNLGEVLLAAREAGCIDVRINTNLIPLTFDKAVMLKQFCDLISVSMDGIDKEVYEKIRRRGDFQRFHDNLMMLLAIPGPARVKVQMVVQRDNEQTVELFKEVMATAGADEIATPDVMQRTPDGKGLQSATRRTAGRKICGHPFQRLVIGYDGKAYGCCNSWNDEYVVGKFPEQSLWELWNCERMGELRQMALERPQKTGFPCNDCSVGSSYMWVDVG